MHIHDRVCAICYCRIDGPASNTYRQYGIDRQKWGKLQCILENKKKLNRLVLIVASATKINGLM